MTYSPQQEISIFGLLRHGETLWNTQKKIQGSCDSPLTPNGIAETREWFKTLSNWDWDQIYASDLGRVQQTVAILNEDLQLPVYFDHRLREQDWGDWEGRTLLSIKRDHKRELNERVALGWEFSAPGGETRTSVRNRVFKTLRHIEKKTPCRKTLLVCHRGVINTVLYHLSGRRFMPEEDPLLQHNKLHLIACHKGVFKIHMLNITRQSTK